MTLVTLTLLAPPLVVVLLASTMLPRTLLIIPCVVAKRLRSAVALSVPPALSLRLFVTVTINHYPGV